MHSQKLTVFIERNSQCYRSVPQVYLSASSVLADPWVWWI